MREKITSRFEQINYVQTTFASVVAIMALLMVDSSWATHRKVLSKSDSSASPIFNVMDYGAHADGLKDDRTVNIFSSII